MTVPFAPHPWDEIVPRLFQGGHLFVLRDHRAADRVQPVIVRDEFDVVFSLHSRGPGYGPDPEIHHRTYPMPDGPLDGDQLVFAQGLAASVVLQHGLGRRVLVRCNYGYNRSGLIVGLALIGMGHTADDAIALIRRRRSRHALTNPHFVQYLRSAQPPIPGA